MSAAITDYMLQLVDIACDGPSSRDNMSAVPPPSLSGRAATFVADTLRAMGSERVLITRTGTNRAADILFGHPDVMTLFGSAGATVTLRTIINAEILPTATPVFRDHWTYIIGPAMDEHVAVALLTCGAGRPQ